MFRSLLAAFAALLSGVTVAACLGAAPATFVADGGLPGEQSPDSSLEDEAAAEASTDAANPSANMNGSASANADGGVDSVVDAGLESGVTEAGPGPGCDPTELVCNTRCTPNDVHNCGACGHDCTMLPNVTGTVTCSSGTCVFDNAACAQGFAHCGSDADQGCETAITTTSHCGSCTNTCVPGSQTPLCSATGTCVSGCTADQTLCNGTCTNTSTDGTNCGTCGHVCSSGATCSSGSCACNHASYSTCSNTCVDTTSNSSNCGGCGNGCSSPDTCVGSSCVCVPNCSGRVCGLDALCGVSCGTCPGTQSCLSGACGCGTGTTACGSATNCVNLQFDANNCGACGHSCFGGQCSSGVCAPVTLASGQSLPSGIAVDGTNVYWTNCTSNSTVMKCAIGSCSPTPLATGQSYPYDIAIDANNAYWTNDVAPGGGAYACALGGCNNAPTLLGAGANPNGIAVASGKVYWVNSNGADLVECATTGCGQSPTTLVSGLNDPYLLALDSQKIYFDTATATGTIYSCGLGGCSGTPATLATSQNTPEGIVVAGGQVYWDDTVSGAIMTCSTSSCTPTTYISGQSLQPSTLGTDGINVYWSTGGGANVLRCPVGSSCSSPTTVATGQSAEFFAFDATSVYWTNYGYGTIMRLAK